MSTAGLVVIGDEILSGKTADTNTPFVIHELRELGVALRQIVVIPDVLDEIATVTREASERHDHVFTSGGIGPTHDDLTIAGVARAFHTHVERHADLEKRLRAYYEARGLQLPERNLRLADVPVGSTLLFSDQLQWPVLLMHNVYILPGIPEIFRRKFLAIKERFRAAPFHLREIYVREEEAVIAPHLDRVVASHPTIALGSYPLWTAAPDGYRVKLTLEGKDEGDVERAYDELRQLIGPASIVRHA